MPGRKDRVISVWVGLLVGCLATTPLVASRPNYSSTERYHKYDRMCYYTVYNKTDEFLRETQILLDADDFTETGLRKLMERFRQMYSEPNMYVFLASRVEQLYPSNNLHLIRDHPLELTVGHSPAQYAEGVFIYEGVNQVIRYNAPGEELHTVVVQGVDMFGAANR